MDPYFYLDGEFLKQREAKIPIENIGLNRAYGIFDFFRIREGQPTFFEDYLDRFISSQKFLNLNMEFSRDEIKEIVSELLHRNGFKEGICKLLLLGESTDHALEFRPLLSVVNLPYYIKTRPDSMNVITYEYVRDHPHIKSLNYFTSFALNKKMREIGASEVIYHTDFVSEASRSNVFVVKDGIALTPSQNILKGINRMHVMNAIDGVVPCEIKDFDLMTMMSADEIFITGTLKEVTPILAVDGKPVGSGKVGEASARIRKIYEEYLRDWSVRPM